MEAALQSPMPLPSLTPRELKAVRYRLTAEAFLDRALITAAEDEDAVNDWRAVFALADWAPPRFPVRAQDAVDRGALPGPALGRLMKELESWWIDSDFRPDRAACLRVLTRQLGR